MLKIQKRAPDLAANLPTAAGTRFSKAIAATFFSVMKLLHQDKVLFFGKKALEEIIF